MAAKPKLNVMLVDSSAERRAVLKQALLVSGYSVQVELDTYESLNDRVNEYQPDVIIIDMDSPGRDMLEHMRVISSERPKPIVMFAEQSDSSTIEQAVKAGVSAYVVDGLNPSRVKPIIDVAIARFREFHSLKQELHETKSKLAERKIIDKAKGILMRRRDMTEDEAYKALRKMAMDKNMRLVQAAENLIAISELLG